MTVLHAYVQSDHCVQFDGQKGQTWIPGRRMSRYGREERLFYLGRIYHSEKGYIYANGSGRPKTKYQPIKGMIRSGLLEVGSVREPSFRSFRVQHDIILKLTEKGRKYFEKYGR